MTGAGGHNFKWNSQDGLTERITPEQVQANAEELSKQGNSLSKGPEAGVHPSCSRNSKEASEQ